MQNNEDINKIRPILDPHILEDGEETKRELTEEEKQEEVVPEDFDRFNLDAVEKLKESKDEK